MINKKEQLLILDNVSFRYNDTENYILDSVYVVVHKGDRVGIIGGNGSGKSTLTKLILGIVKPNKGVITLFNRPTIWSNHFSKLGYIGDPGYNSEQLGLPGKYTIRQVIKTLCKLENIPFKDFATQELVTNLGLETILDRKIAYLSTGERKRVMVCLTFLREPDFIILDEPFDGLDSSVASYIEQMLRNLIKNREITLFYIAHNIIEIDTYTDNVFLLKDGKLISIPQQMFDGTLSSKGNLETFQEKTGEVIGRMIKFMQSEKSNSEFSLSLTPLTLPK